MQAQQHTQQSPSAGTRMARATSAPAIRRCSSTPCFVAADDRGADVWVSIRPFHCQLPGLLERVKRTLLFDCGIAHYVVVVRCGDDGFCTYDFGPIGRDIAVAKPSGIWRNFLGRRSSRTASMAQSIMHDQRDGPIGGEVREKQVKELPPASVYMGRTTLSLSDIRQFNQLQSQIYRLHQNDCRHYVNKLVKYATGVDSATKSATRQVFATKRRRWHLGDQLIANCGHHLTDVGSWPRLRAAGQAALAAMAAMSSQRMFTGIVSRRAPIAAQATVVPVMAAQRAPALARVPLPRPPRALLPVGAAAAAGAAAGEASFLSAVGDSVKSATSNAVSLFQGLGRSAVVAASAAGQAAGKNASGASVLTAGLYGAATRGLAGVMAGRRGQGAPSRPQLRAMPRWRKPPADRKALVTR